MRAVAAWLVALVWAWAAATASADPAIAGRGEPALEHCLLCHGPDEKARKGG